MTEPFKIKAKLPAAQVARIVLNQGVGRCGGLYNVWRQSLQARLHMSALGHKRTSRLRYSALLRLGGNPLISLPLSGHGKC
jgi:hypothetical protein